MAANPLRIGLAAARTNFVPALILQALMATIAIGYYWHPPTRELLHGLAEIKQRSGYLFSAIAGIIAGGLLPELFVILCFQKGKLLRTNFDNLKFTVIYWGLDGMAVDAMYRAQAIWFGEAAAGGSVLYKVLVDQLIITPFIFTPISLVCYEWKRRNYQPGAIATVFSRAYFRERTVPAIVSCWAVWFPLLFAIYAFPSALQLPMFALALSIWVMLFTYITTKELRVES